MTRSLRILFLKLCVVWGSFESLILLLKYLYIIDFPVGTLCSGTFDNPGPAGGFIAFCLSVSIGLMLNEKQTVLKYALALSVLIQSVALIITRSRSAWFAIYIVLSIIFVKKNHNNLLVILFLTIIVIIGLYFIRPASVLGRLLIWRVCLDMISKRPLLGFGVNGFRSNYMLFQADYFDHYPDSIFLPYADNIHFAYNEFLHVFVNFGIVGIASFAGLIYLCFKVRSMDDSSTVLKLSFSSLLSFSFFSYPFSIPRLFILFMVCFLLLEKTPPAALFLNNLINSTLLFILICGAALSFIHNSLTNLCQDLFSPYTSVALAAKTKIEKRYGLISHFPDIMDSYAAFCIEKEPLQKERVLQDAAKVSPSCELFSALGNIKIEEEHIEEGLEYYKTASKMIPLRILPRYKLFDFYYMSGCHEMALKTGKEILNLPIKVRSSDSIIMLNDVREKSKQIQLHM